MAISHISTTFADGDTVVVPAHDARDLLIFVAYRTGTAFATGSMNGSEVVAGGSGANYARVNSVRDTSNSYSGYSLQVDNATSMLCMIYRSSEQFHFVAANGVADGNTSSNDVMAYPDLSRPSPGDEVWYLRIGCNRLATDLLATAPAGWTVRSASNTRIIAMDSNGDVGGQVANDIGADSQTVNQSTSWRTHTLALREVLTPRTADVAAQARGPVGAMSSGQELAGTITTAAKASTAAAAGNVSAVAVAANVRSAVAALAGTHGQSAALAAATKKVLGSLAANQGIPVVVAAAARKATAAIAAQNSRPPIWTAVATPQAALTAEQGQAGAIASATPRVTAALTAIRPLIESSVSRPVGALVASQSQSGSVAARARKPLVAAAASHRQQGTLLGSTPKAAIAAAGSMLSTGVIAMAAKKPVMDSQFVIFPTATVFTLSGLNFNLYNDMPEKFGGMFDDPPRYVMQKIDYPASLSKNSVPKGVKAFDDAVRQTPGLKIGLCQSQGDQVAKQWIEENRDDPTAPPPSELMFIFTGNPLRPGSGYLIGRAVVNGGLGTPTPTDGPWTVIDFARRYDGWADWPSDESNQWAVDNAKSGKQSLHRGYHEADLFAPTNTVWRTGNYIFVLTQERPPLLEKYGGIDADTEYKIHSKIEEGYDSRPPNDPPLVAPPTPTRNKFWRALQAFFNLDEI